jgi:hypothetical protein
MKLIREGAVDWDFECCDAGYGSGDVARKVGSVTTHGQSNTFLLLLVCFLIAYYFSVSDLSICQDVSEFDEKTCVGTGDVPNALE